MESTTGMATLTPRPGGRYLSPIEEYPPHVQKTEIPSLISRCAKALDYEIVEQAKGEGNTAPDPARSSPRPVAV